jgi:L-alanine-DL-glutamate epimerase-like enolase superfamily enzyme
MKITGVKITPPLGRQNRNWVLMKVFTDEGIVGLGEYSPGAGSSTGLKGMLVGKDPMNINKLHHDHLMGMRGVGAGIEIALKGKKLGVPIWSLGLEMQDAWFSVTRI